jgi:pimeloyl-ACP methyl ester carboxylesterase
VWHWCEGCDDTGGIAVGRMTDRVHVLDQGTGSPTFLLVHGFGCAHDDWRAQVAALSRDNRCIAVDLPGHGATPVSGPPTIAALAAALNRVKRESGARDVILVGHSLGAKVVREAYAQDRDDVVGLVLVEGRYYRGDTPALVAEAGRTIDHAGFHAFAERFFSGMFRDDDRSAARRNVLDRLARFDPAFGRALYLDSIGWDDERGIETLAGIEVPVVVLQSTSAENGKRVPLAPGMTTPFMDLVTAHVPHATTTIVPGCAHFPMLEAPDAVNRALREFARRVTVARSM